MIEARARWAGGGRSIVTETLLRDDAGRETRIRQLGGSVDGIAMVVLHAPPLLSEGERVRAELDLRPGDSARLVSVSRLGDKIGSEKGHFVPTRTEETSSPLRWSEACARLRYHPAGTNQLEGDAEFAILDKSVAEWMAKSADCSAFSLEVAEPAAGEVALDGENRVLFRDDRWCRPAAGDDPEECYDPTVAGLTTIFYVDDEDSDRDGEILDADIELNGVYFAISSGGESNEGGNRCQADLANTFTHELGHLMGLDHTCFAGQGPHLSDESGELIPRCDSNLPAALTEATMYNFQSCGERKKVTVEADDVAGICFLYSGDVSEAVCENPIIDRGGCGGCGAADSPGENPPFWLLALAAVFWVRGRPRRRRGTQGTSL